MLKLKKIIIIMVFILIIVLSFMGCSDSDIETKVETQKNQIESLLDKITDIETELSQKTDDLSVNVSTINQLEEELDSVKAENELLKQEVLLLNDEIFNLQDQLEQLVDITDPDSAKDIIEDISNEVLVLLSEDNYVSLSEFVHPVHGVRFTPYTYVRVEDIILNASDIENAESDTTLYLWGVSPGPGENIELTITDYFSIYVYDEDYLDAEEIGYNEIVSSTGMIENQLDFYDDSIIVEYYFSGFNPDYEGLDWTSLRLVFQQHDGEWYLSGIIHNEWTP